MQITRLADAPTYIAPKHYDMRSLRLQGMDASEADFAWVGLSYLLPGGGAEMDAGALGKIYVVIDGEVTIELGGGELRGSEPGGGERYLLHPLDSCFIAAGEARAVLNESNRVATMLVVMPRPGQST